MPRSAWNALLASAIVAVTLAACTGQRPLHVVRANAEQAARTGQWDVAEADFAEYVGRRPDATDVRFQLAKAQIAGGKPRQAIEHLTVALDVSPLNDAYLDAQAQAMFAANEREALTALLNRAAAERGRVADYVRLGTYAAQLGNADEAQQALITAAKLDGGTTVRPQLALADFYGSMGATDKQVRRLRMAYSIEPANDDLLKKIREVGEIPGPTFGIPPDDSR